MYNYTDHLGNIRLKYTLHPETGERAILEEDHYYPYGLKHNGYNGNHEIVSIRQAEGNVILVPVTPFLGDSYKYKFGGMEYSDEFDINTYDFGARNYDPALGRWMNMDPLAEMMRRHSPYNYAFNSPVFFIDPDGMMPRGVTEFSTMGLADMSMDFGSGNESGAMKTNEVSNNSAAYSKIFQQAGEKMANADLSLGGGGLYADNGYDVDGNKVNDKGGDEVDYLYDKDGKEIESTKVQFKGISSAERIKNNLQKNNDNLYEGYGVRGWAMATGAITSDNTLFEMYAGGKTIGTAFNMTKVPLFKAIGAGIKKYTPSLGRGQGLRIGISTSRGREVFRATYGNRTKHFFDIDLGKIPKK